ncbi:hypothetical protein A2501_05385 [Candidatus Uhrbacteria bacterium RIFOXYC12_FULL_57_11]|nr:MAG: hypothetical protein A2501_05385 [Candidatus Uhrbacteria bacterium RIFOXYC12_FULL_57_11]
MGYSVMIPANCDERSGLGYLMNALRIWMFHDMPDFDQDGWSHGMIALDVPPGPEDLTSAMAWMDRQGFELQLYAESHDVSVQVRLKPAKVTLAPIGPRRVLPPRKVPPFGTH